MGFGSSFAEGGAVLLEVILALVLFVGAAAVITVGMNASVDGVERLKVNTHAANLAVSVLSELQMGLRPLEATETQAFEPPFENWTWELQVNQMEDELGEVSSLVQVEVIIRRKDSAFVHRLSEVLRVNKDRRLQTGSMAGASF
jgi:type II secretion system protein I